MTRWFCWALVLAIGAMAAMVVLLRLLAGISLDEVAVPLPIASAVARIQGADGGYVIVVDTPRGRVRQKMWDNWGPAHRTSLYVTPEGWVVALGGGGDDTMIAIAEDSAPILVEGLEQLRTKSETWRYIGAVDLKEGRLRFFSPSEQSECFAMFGAGSSPYRMQHQAEHFCPRV